MSMLVHADGLVHYATHYDATTFLWCLGGQSIPWIWRNTDVLNARHVTCLGCITRGAPTRFELLGWAAQRANRDYPKDWR
jgi:hypothetical protein